jgi:DNA-binding IclR family transcriptional regulator
MDDKIKNKSLAKAFSILECFLDNRYLGITELSKILGLSKSSIHDAVSTLEALGYMSKDTSTGKYYLGINCVRIGRAAMSNYEFKDIASNHIREISNQVGETCYLTIPHGFSVYFLDVAVPEESRIFTPALPNSTDAMSCTGGGKCMLAASSDEFIQDCIANGLPQMTENTITDPEKFWDEIRLIRERGYAVDDMEYSIGIRCVARPIISLDGSLLGSISISGPSPRMTDEKILEYSELLKRHIYELVHSI